MRAKALGKLLAAIMAGLGVGYHHWGVAVFGVLVLWIIVKTEE